MGAERSFVVALAKIRSGSRAVLSQVLGDVCLSAISGHSEFLRRFAFVPKADIAELGALGMWRPAPDTIALMRSSCATARSPLERETASGTQFRQEGCLPAAFRRLRDLELCRGSSQRPASLSSG